MQQQREKLAVGQSWKHRRNGSVVIITRLHSEYVDVKTRWSLSKSHHLWKRKLYQEWEKID